MTPLVSVIMSVYNSEKYLKQAIESILNQTYRDYEFIIVNDCSTDKSKDIISSFKDSRIIQISNEKNVGLAVSLNRAIAKSRGEYILRMDADDISVSDRIAIQVDFLDKNTDIDLCGSWMKIIGRVNPWQKIWQVPTDHESIKSRLLFNSSICHPTVIFRRTIINKYNPLYNENQIRTEDYELWCRLIDQFKFANIPSPLVCYRRYINQNILQYGKQKESEIIKIRENMMNKIGGYSSDFEANIHNSIGNCEYIDKKSAIKWLDKLILMNNKINYYHEPEFSLMIMKIKKSLNINYYLMIYARRISWYLISFLKERIMKND